MDVRTRDIVERLKEILRAKVNDPFDRGSTATETLSSGSTTLQLSNKELKNVDSAIGASTGNEYYRFKDFSVSFDDPSNSSDYPSVTFDSAPSEDVDITYHYGATFIYPTWPSDNISKTIVSINHIGGSQSMRFMGLNKSASTKATINQSSWQIDVWVEDGANVTDPDAEHSGFFSGGKLCDYMADQVKQAMEESRDHLKEQGVSDVELTLERDDPYQEDIESYRKVINYTLTHNYEW